MKKRRFNRVLALMLSIMMIYGPLSGAIGTAAAQPGSDVAENTSTGAVYSDVASALDAAANGETIRLISNATLANAIVYNRNNVGVTLDLNGYSIIRTVSGGGETGADGAVYVSDGLLTICDTSASESGYIEYINSGGLGGSGLNIGASGSVKLLSGGILGTGQSVFAHDAGGRFEMSGGVVYGSGDHPGSEAIAAVSGAYVTIAGGFVGTKHAGAAMIWSGATLDPSFWSITGGYFTSSYYNDGPQREIAGFVTQGQVTELDTTRTHAISGETEYRYHLTIPRSIAFDGNGGVSPVAMLTTDAFGKLASLPANATKSGLDFAGWFTAATGGTQITANYIFDRDTTVYAQYTGPAVIPDPPALTAVGDDANNMVRLNWTSSLAGQEYYMVYQKDSGGDGLDEYQSIPLKTDIKVLNIYPDISGSDGAKDWMQAIMASAPDGYAMAVDKVAISDFNGSDSSTNYAHYLTKDSNGAYAYDVLYFGAWDVNYGRDMSADAYAAVESFIQYGGGVLVGHDTASFNHVNFIDLAKTYLNMDVKFQEHQGNPSFPPFGSSRVEIQRRGFPMNYPFALGNVGDVLYTPVSHSYYQFAKGDVWFKYNNLEWGPGPEINSYMGEKGTTNFYLTTWNNTAMIQTGHSNGMATVDEQKILANTFFYLAQTSTANSFNDRMSQDVAAPNAVSGTITVAPGSAVGKQQLGWNAATDNGSSYAYYLKAISFTDGSSRQSAEATATVTTGIKGYAVTVDTNAAGSDPGKTVTTTTAAVETNHLQAGITYYAHIRAIDNADNASEIVTIAFTIEAGGLTVTSLDPSGKANDGKTKVSVLEELGQGNKWVYLNVNSGTVAIPAIGGELEGYTDLPANGLIAAADGDKIAVAEVNADGKVVRFGQTVAVVAPSANELSVFSVDPSGSENNGKTRMVAGAGTGNNLVYFNFGQGEVAEPAQGQTLSDYTALPASGIIQAAKGDRIGIAELSPDGKVLRFGSAKAVVQDEWEATGLTVAVTDPTGAGTDGKTKVSVHASQGNKLLYVNFKQGPVTIPAAESSLTGAGYAELPDHGLVEADNGDLLGIAEIDPSGKVVRYAAIPAIVVPDSAAKGLPVGAKDATGAESEGKTQLTGSVGEGHKLVYLNFGEGPVTAPTTGQPAGRGYVDVPADGGVEARNGDILGVAEVDENGNVVRFGTTTAVVSPESAAKGLPVAATDASGAGTDGKTRMVSKASEGNKLVYVNFGDGSVQVPGIGETLAGYAELPENGVIEAKPGDKIGIAEIGPDGKVLKYGVTAAVVVPEAAAKPLPAISVEPSGAGSDGKTVVQAATGTTIGSGNKLVYYNAGQKAIAVPETGALLAGYSELPVNGIIDASEGDNIGLAEVDASGKVVRFGTTKAVVANANAAKGLNPTATDPVGEGTEGKTKLAISTQTGQGNKLVYLNVGTGVMVKPEVGDTLKGYKDMPSDGLIDAGNGDVIGVAEIDEFGKVVKFGWTEAVVYADAAASGLQATSVDPAGSSNDGKTTIMAAAAAGNKLVYVNFGKQMALTPNTGELLTGYADLPADGIVAAVHGDCIAVAELDAAGRVIRFGTVNAVVVDSAQEYSGGGFVGMPASSSQGVEVLVNGKVEYAGTAKVTTDNGRSVTTIDVDQAKLQAKLEAEGHGAVITVPWAKSSDVVVGQLTGRMIQEMEDREATLVLDIPAGSYRIPTGQLHIATLAKQFGGSVKLEDVQLQIHIAVTGPETVQAAKNVSEKYGVSLMAPPVTFKVNAQYKGQSIEVTDYSVYVERTVALPEGIDPNKITTGVVLEPDGTLRHVPTKVTKSNETYYAKINSLTNSDYGIIWNPMTFTDLSGHWSEASVNNMGSRLVVNGVGGGKFNPDADITRAEFAAIVVRGLGLRLDQGDVAFTDVNGSEWYASVVNTAVQFGLIKGYEDGSFRPKNKITRQEAMTIVARAMSITGLKEQVAGSAQQSGKLDAFRDANTVASWAREGASLAVAAKIMQGRTADLLKPKAFITRAEVATIVERLLQYSDLIEMKK